MSKSKMLALTVVAVAAVVLAGGLVASNMGFKLNYVLLGSTDPGSASGTNYVSLPYNPQVGIGNAQELFKDIGAEGGAVTELQRHLRASNTFEVYKLVPGGVGVTNFVLTPGEGYIFNMAGGAFNYIIVGSHNPAATVTLEGTGVGGSASGTNYYAHPYHGVAATAKELFLETGAVEVQSHIRSSNAFAVYKLVPGGVPDFALNPGEANIVNMPNGASLVFTPAHY